MERWACIELGSQHWLRTLPPSAILSNRAQVAPPGRMQPVDVILCDGEVFVKARFALFVPASKNQETAYKTIQISRFS